MNSRIKLVIIGGISLLLLAIVAFYLTVIVPARDKNPVVAEVGGEKIYLSDYKERLYAVVNEGTPKDPTYSGDAIRASLLDELIEMKILESELKSRNLTVDPSRIESEAEKLGGVNYKTGGEDIKQAHRNYVKLKLGRDLLKDKMLTWKKGFALYCRYDRGYQDDYKDKQAQGSALIEKDKIYAKNYCEAAKQRLESGTFIYIQELAKLKGDNTLGDAAWNPTYYINFGIEFDKDNFSEDHFLMNTDMFTQVSSQKNATGKYQVLQVKNLEDKNNIHDSAYILTYVEKENNGEVLSYQEWLKKKIEELKVKKFEENTKS